MFIMEGIKTLALHDINHCSYHTVPAAIAAPLTPSLERSSEERSTYYGLINISPEVENVILNRNAG
jgi:hypothetical protein